LNIFEPVAQKSLGKSEIMTKNQKKNITNTNKYNIEPVGSKKWRPQGIPLDVIEPVGSKNGGPRAYPLMSLNQ
jgi:hypothetical protein